MKKEPIIYNEQVIGYIDNIEYNDDIIINIKIYLFNSNFFTEIVNKIHKSSLSKLNGIIFDYLIEDDLLILKNKKYYENNN